MRFPARSSAPLLLVLALGAGGPGTAAASEPPIAAAAGGDTIALTYPSLVKARVARATRALDRAIQLIEDDKIAKANVKLAQVRRQTSAAWRGARYVIRTAPPPVAEEDRVRPHAHASGDGPTGPVKAAPADTAFLVLTLQHDVVSRMIQLVDDTRASGFAAVSTTLRFALDRRDKAIADIADLAPPPVADEDSAGPRARASGGAPVASTFETVMPNAIVDLEDELQGIDGIRSDSEDLSSAGRRLLAAAAKRVSKTKRAVNKAWPPVPAED